MFHSLFLNTINLFINIIIRSKEDYERLFLESGLIIIHTQKQNKWPQNLFPVYMWALKKQ